MSCEITMHSKTIFKLVTTFHSACFMAASLSSDWRGFHLRVCPQVKTPPEGEALDDGQAIALAIAMTWERAMIRTMSFKSVITFQRASFMTVSLKKDGQTAPPGRVISPGGERTNA